MSDFLSTITNKEVLLEIINRMENGNSKKIDEQEMIDKLKRRVKGQDHVLSDVSRLIRLQWAKEKRKKPIANLLFLGPTGTGKTELANALAEYFYEDEKAMLTFRCSEFSGPEGKTRLIGVPSGYQGWEKGGQLTRPVINNPRRIICFDECEKGFSGVFDLFLQMMGEGVLTEQGTGKEADFTQSIIMLTSNAEYQAICKIQNEVKDPHERINAIKNHLVDSKVFRPEIIGRIDRVCVFKPLKGIIIAEIAALKIIHLAKSYGLNCKYIDAHIIYEAMKANTKVEEFGIRELKRIIDDRLAGAMVAAKDAGATSIKLDINEEGVLEVNPAD